MRSRSASAVSTAFSIEQRRRSTANSSPPMRASTSLRRTPSLRIVASRRSSASPAGCPQVSLTSLN
jgi:hypothetical protein